MDYIYIYIWTRIVYCVVYFIVCFFCMCRSLFFIVCVGLLFLLFLYVKFQFFALDVKMSKTGILFLLFYYSG